MSPRYINFFAFSFFCSVLICLVLEGSYFSTFENSVVNDLSLFTTIKIGGLVPIPAFNLYFFRGVYRILVFDYSFYEGGFAIIRIFWLLTLTGGAVWGIGQVFAPVFANLLRIFR